MKLTLLGSTRTWIISVVVASVATSVAVWSLYGGTASTISNPIQGLTITPEKATVEAGGTLRLTAEGDFGTMTMPVRADWFFLEPESDATGTLDGCERSKTCDFHAGDMAGIAVVQAQVGDGDAVATTKITVTESLKNPFKDELPAWALPSIVHLYRQGIVKGYDDGRYGPADSLTRGQIVTLIVRMLTKANLIQQGESCTRALSDVPATHYAYTAVCAFGNRGWIVPKGNFRPDAVASRGETAGFLASAILETLEKDGAAGSTQIFEDVSVSSPFFRTTALLQRAGIMTGYPNGDFGAKDPINRAAAAVAVERTLKMLGKGNVKAPPSTPDPTPHVAAPVDASSAPADVLDWNTVSLSSLSSPHTPITAMNPVWKWPMGWAESEGVCKKPDPVRPSTEKFRCCEMCPSTDSDRFYLPFTGNDCEPGDAVRDDLSPKECANPLLERYENLPLTYGAHCPRTNLRGELIPSLSSTQPLLAQVTGVSNAVTESMCSSLQTTLEVYEQNLARAHAALAPTVAELKEIDRRERESKIQLTLAQQRFADYVHRRNSFRETYTDSQGYPVDTSGNRIAEYVHAESTLQNYERAIAFQQKLRSNLTPTRVKQQAEVDRLTALRDATKRSLDECRRNLEQQRKDEEAAQRARLQAEERRKWDEKVRRFNERNNRGELPPDLGLGRQCCNGQNIKEALRSCRYVRIDDIKVAYVYPNVDVAIKNLEDFRAYMENVEKVNELLGGEAMTGMDHLIERITEFADLAGIDVEIDNPVSADAVMEKALAFMKELKKHNPILGITVYATPIDVDYSRLWTATTPPGGGLCIEAMWTSREGHVSGIDATQNETYDCLAADPNGPMFKFPGSSDKAAMCIPENQQMLVNAFIDVVKQMKSEILGGHVNDKLCPPEPELGK